MECAVSKTSDQPAELNLFHFLVCLLCACSLAGMALCGKVMTDEGVGVLVQCTSMICGSFFGTGITEWMYPGSLRTVLHIARGGIDDMDWTLHVWFWISAVGTEFLWLTIFCTELFFDSANTLALSQGLSVVFITVLASIFVARPMSSLSLMSVLLCVLGVGFIVIGQGESSHLGMPVVYIALGAFLNALRNVAVETLCEFNSTLFVNEVIVSARFALGGPLLALLSLIVSLAMAGFAPSMYQTQVNFAKLDGWFPWLIWFSLMAMFLIAVALATVSIVSMGVVWTNVVLQSVIPITLFAEMVIRHTSEKTLTLIGMSVVVLGSLIVPLLSSDPSALDTDDPANENKKRSVMRTNSEYEEIPDGGDFAMPV